MHVHQFAIQFGNRNGALRGRDVTPSGLHGLFYDVVRRVDASAATWLHEHSSPKPYTIAPAHYDKKRIELAGMLISTLSNRSAEIITHAFQTAFEQHTQLALGKQPCWITDLTPIDNTSFELLSHSDPCRQFELQFLTPCSFRQGIGDLLFPLPYNVFSRPYFVWQTYAPEAYQLPSDWLAWCEQCVFAGKHEVRSVQKNISRNKRYVGFVGHAQFKVKVQRDADEQHTRLYSSIFHALGRFATFSGIGRKTTMGMGSVEMLQ